MQLSAKEIEALLVRTLARIALERRARGSKLSRSEAVSVITAAALEAARVGKSVEETMRIASRVLTKNDVMEGVAELIALIQVDAVFAEGRRCLTLPAPIDSR